MIKAIAKYIEEQRLFAGGERVLIGASGGADSTALVYALHFLRERMGISIALAHLHHGIRGAEADEDLRAVESLAARLDLPLFSERCDVPGLAAASGMSIEMGARAARLDFFRKMAAGNACDLVALAHNRDDQAETVLLRLLRGAGRTGLSGIAPVQSLEDLQIIHPMLGISHRQAVDFLRVHGLAWREDASNSSRDYLRNRIRHSLLPLIESEINPGIRATLARSAEILSAEEDFFAAAVDAAASACRVGDGRELDAARLLTLHPALRRRVLLAWFYAVGLPPQEIDFDAVRAAEGLLADMRGSSGVDLGGGWRLLREYRRLTIVRPARAAVLAPPRELSVPGISECPELGLRVVIERGRGILREAGGMPGRIPSACSISAARLAGRPLVLRVWRTGDRMRPYGMAGSRKLQDILCDCKVPQARRRRVPVIESLGEIVWLPGYRIADDWAVAGPDSECLLIKLEPFKG